MTLDWLSFCYIFYHISCHTYFLNNIFIVIYFQIVDFSFYIPVTGLSVKYVRRVGIEETVATIAFIDGHDS